MFLLYLHLFFFSFFIFKSLFFVFLLAVPASQGSTTPPVRRCSPLRTCRARRIPTSPSTPTWRPGPSRGTPLPLPRRALRDTSKKPSFTAGPWGQTAPLRATPSRPKAPEAPCRTPPWDTSTRGTPCSCSPAQLTSRCTRWHR